MKQRPLWAKAEVSVMTGIICIQLLLFSQHWSGIILLNPHNTTEEIKLDGTKNLSKIMQPVRVICSGKPVTLGLPWSLWNLPKEQKWFPQDRPTGISALGGGGVGSLCCVPASPPSSRLCQCLWVAMESLRLKRTKRWLPPGCFQFFHLPHSYPFIFSSPCLHFSSQGNVLHTVNVNCYFTCITHQGVGQDGLILFHFHGSV